LARPRGVKMILRKVDDVHPNAKTIATLALGSRLRQGFVRSRAKREAGSHTTYSQECEV